MKFTLTHLTGSRAGAVQELSGQVITVGRDPSNALAFDPSVDAAVSGFHANLTATGAQVLLSDLGSSNGTFVNGQRVQGSAPLVSGCQVQFGEGGPILNVQFVDAAAGAASGAAGAAGGAPGASALSAPAGALSAPAGAPSAAPAGGLAQGAPAAQGMGAPGIPGAPTAPGAPGMPGAPTAPGVPGAPPPPKVPSPGMARLKGCGLKVVGTIVGTLLIGGVCYFFRGQLQQVVPSSAQRYLRKIPGVSLIFTKAKSPTQALPPGARDAKRLMDKGKAGQRKSEASEPEKTGE